MTITNDDSTPMGEAGKHPAGPGTGGIAQTVTGGLGDALQRSSENGDADATGIASTGNASGGAEAPRVDLGGKNAPGSAPGAIGAATQGTASASTNRGASSGADHADAAPGSAATRDTERSDDDPTTGSAEADRDEPRDESAAESLGRAVSEVVTGPVEDGQVDRTRDQR